MNVGKYMGENLMFFSPMENIYMLFQILFCSYYGTLLPGATWRKKNVLFSYTAGAPAISKWVGSGLNLKI